MTFRERIERFPEPYRSQMLKNTESDTLERETGIMADRELVSSLFVWDGTPEGDRYWMDFSDKQSADAFDSELVAPTRQASETFPAPDKTVFDLTNEAVGLLREILEELRKEKQ